MKQRWFFNFPLCVAVMAAALSARVYSADEPADRAQVQAAMSDAVRTLRVDIEDRRIDYNLTVADFVRATGSEDQFVGVLRRAEQIGGPRWIDGQTCQVKLEISGERIAGALTDIAAANPDRSPVPAEALARKLEGWKKRSFVATGSSLRADSVTFIRPAISGPWQSVDESSRGKAVAAARDNAVGRVIEDIKSIKLGDSGTVDDLLRQNPPLKQSLSEWIAARPVTAVHFSDDLQVDYEPAIAGDDLFDQLIAAARKANAKLPDDAALTVARNEFRKRLATDSIIGRASAARTIASRPIETDEVRLPAQPPDWIFRQIDAEATAPFRDSLLRTKQEAEDRAIDVITYKLMAQPLTDKLSVVQASKRSPAIRDAISRAASRVRVYKVDYGANGSVTVRMMLDPREFWYDASRQ